MRRNGGRRAIHPPAVGHGLAPFFHESEQSTGSQKPHYPQRHPAAGNRSAAPGAQRRPGKSPRIAEKAQPARGQPLVK